MFRPTPLPAKAVIARAEERTESVGESGVAAAFDSRIFHRERESSPWKLRGRVGPFQVTALAASAPTRSLHVKSQKYGRTLNVSKALLHIKARKD